MAEVGYIFPEDAAKQVVEVGNAIKATDDKLLKYTEDASKLIALLKQQNISFEQLQKVQKETVETTTKLDAIGKTLLDSETKLKQVTDKRTESIIRNRAETRNATRDIQLKVRAQQAEKGSIEQLSAVNAILEKRLKSVNLATVDGAKKAEILRNAINRNTQKIMSNSSEFSKWKINIGNYRSALESLPGPIGNIVNQTGNMITKIASLGPVGGMVAGTIIAAGAQLAAFFTKTEAGAEMLERKWAGMKAAWSVLVGELAEGGKKVAESFEDSTEQSTLWTGILSALSPALTGLGVRMDLASTAAEKYTLQIQQLEDAERGMIVPRAQANQQIKEAMLLYADQSKSVEARMKALQNAIALENQTADTEIEHQKSVVANIKIINDEKKKAGLLRDEDDKKLQEAMAKEIELSTESMGRQIRATARINAARKEIAAEVENAAEAEKKRLEEEQKATEKRIKIWADEVWAKQEAENEKIKANDKYMADFAKQIEEEQKLIDEKLDDEVSKTIAAGEKILEEKQKLADKEADQRKQNEEQFKQDAINQGLELGNFLFENKKKQLELEFQQAEGNAAKQTEIKKKIAKQDKEQALFNIAVNTAVAISKVLGQTGIFGLAAWIPIAALGAVQSGIVMAQKIPEFAKGTDYAPNEFIAGEKGREIVKTKSGEVIMADKATHFKGNRFKGATVYTNKETEQIIEQSGKGNNFVFDTTDLRDGLKSVEKAINKKPIAITDNSGRIVGRQSSNYRETYLNRLQNGR